MKFATVALLASANALSFGAINVFESAPDRVIKTAPGKFEIVSEKDKLAYKRNGVKFMDVTASIPVEEAVMQGLVAPSDGFNVLTVFSKQIDTLKKAIPVYAYPKKAAERPLVKSLVEKIDIQSVKANLASFTSFYTRYYKSATGLESANWLFQTVTDIVADLKDVLVKKIKHDGWDQYSIIVSIPGKSTDKVVVGAHQDSINLLFPNLLRAPGADDDGSGTVTTLESLRLIAKAIAAGKYTPHNTLEFHYYSAEEGGLLGSVDVFSRYFKHNETVVGMLQQDMTGYTQGTIDEGVEPHFGLISDYTSQHQNDFIKMVVDTYCAIPVHETKCGYACSDHASAIENGFPASFLIESEFKYTSKHIHLTLDTMDRLDFGHVHEHIKLTIGYAIELASAKNLY